MEQIIEAFLCNLVRKKHLRMLLPAAPFVVSFRSEKDVCFVSFCKERAEQLQAGACKADFELVMPDKNFPLLLSRKDRLSTFLKMDELQFKGAYRHFLLLESLFWLAGSPHPDLGKRQPLMIIK
ncbi:hypothetical protein BpJC7_18480 [Weizmannia acidilactici]|uniref:SCP2 domain-containing protein n=1 Tax=Weizmannia acidilactici TaxID=2607726 RepID=A0A5J4JIN1_9BACI|nr:SCP2 sterol-binding domain-containing protein [Weizmannia acidilactici]GER68198.1 hypothetical protein BpJC4_26690 [Weizmannia acidilactici]GER70545.1 hypothetical protein BpJC7_18480 [Weizmannia acidilactici]GER73167.1 hypothetical protein BpPP18_12340 [Weizmannia acidilactici]